MVKPASPEWLSLIKMTLRLINTIDARRLEPTRVAAQVLSASRNVRDAEQYRPRLEDFVRDIADSQD
jgi:hypothetical protein